MIEANIFGEVIRISLIEEFGLVFVRVAAVVFLLPGVAASYVPTRYKLAFAFVLSFTLFSATIDTSQQITIGQAAYWAAMLTEAAYGLILGLTIRAGIFALQIAGTIIAQSSSIAQIFGGSVSNDAQSTVSNILTVAGITLLMTTGFLDDLVGFLLQSYEWFPVRDPDSRALILDLIIRVIANSFSLAFQLALPFLALSLFYNITLGAINRAMPQLLVSFVGAPAIIAASMAMLIIAVKPLLSQWKNSAFDIMALLAN